ncbi:MAG: aminotransferase class III-fold pyridoxal phosphate-dependent enzyme [Rickettsia hoogstraalii]
MNSQDLLVQKSIYPAESDDCPIVFKYGQGAFLYDLNGNKYIDFMNGKGNIILGHNPQHLIAELIDFLKLGMDVKTGFTEVMFKFTHQINKALGYDKIAYFKSGTEAVKAAMLSAKAYNSKKVILSCGYHGYDPIWKFSGNLEEFNENGIINFFFDLALLEKLINKYKGQISAIIISPDPLYLTKEWFGKLNSLIKESNIVMIMDEVKVGFRYNLGLYTSRYGLKPDIAIISKGIANGFPISVVCGYKEMMEGCSNLNYTCFFDAITFFVVTKVMETLSKKDFYKVLNQVSLNLINTISSLIQQFELPIQIKHNGSIFQFIFPDQEASDVFFYESIQHGLIFYPGDNQCFSYAFNDQKYI